MICRPLQTKDIPLLEAMGATSGYEYLDLRGPHVETAQVVEDEHGEIVAAAAAERIIQLFLWASDRHHAPVKLQAVRLLHETMATELKNLGYSEANSFLPPSLEKQFGRRLEKTFGWHPNWRSWFLRF